MKYFSKALALILSVSLLFSFSVLTVTVNAEQGDYTGGTEPIDHEHNYLPEVINPTCTEKGYTVYTCSICHDTYIADYTDTIDHTTGEWITDSEKHWHVCTSCTGILDEAPHSYEWVVTKPATAEETGLKEEICSVCGHKSGQSQVIPASAGGHIPGDINGDGSVNNKDLTRLFQYLSDWDVEVNSEALDVNGDGSVNNKDLTRLFQYLSDWDVEIH